MTQTEIHLIDHCLNCGCYYCYYILLHIAFVVDVLSLLTNFVSISNDVANLLFVAQSPVSLAFSLIMIGAMKNKKLEKAELGFKFAVIVSVLGFFTVSFWLVSW